MTILSAQIALDQLSLLERQVADAKARLCIDAGLPLPSGDRRVEAIIGAAMAVFDLSRAQIVGESRVRRFCRARFAVAYVASQTSGRSSVIIGRALGGRDHTTILNAIDRCAAMMSADRGYAAQVEQLQALFTPKSEAIDVGTC